MKPRFSVTYHSRLLPHLPGSCGKSGSWKWKPSRWSGPKPREKGLFNMCFMIHRRRNREGRGGRRGRVERWGEEEVKGEEGGERRGMGRENGAFYGLGTFHLPAHTGAWGTKRSWEFRRKSKDVTDRLQLPIWMEVFPGARNSVWVWIET